jgi:tripartite-type tricarboxylate transporter receptor subunit TctC
MSAGLRLATMRTLQLAICALCAGNCAGADDYPIKPVKIIIAQAAGGASDVLVRLISPRLAESVGQQIVIDNRPGAGANIGAEIAARSPADGYTIFVASLPHAIAPSLYKNLAYDLLKDFTPVALAAEEQFCLAVHPSLPAINLQEFVAFLKKYPGEVSYGSTGNGAANHLAMELLQSMAGVKLNHVPYRGSSFALTDAINGRVPVLFVNLSPVSGHLQAGKLRALAVTSLKRTPLLPNVPTINESGYPGYDIVNWFGFLAPTGTADDIVRKLNRAITTIVESTDIRKRLAVQGAESLTATPEEMRTFIAGEISKWGKVVKATGARVE